MRIAATCVDAGYHTDAAYRWAKARAHWNVVATVGRAGRGRKLIEEPDLQKLRRTKSKKRPMHIIGVDSGKDLLASRLRIKDPTLPGYITFPTNLDPMFYEQITAEELRTQYPGGRPQQVWVLPPRKAQRSARRRDREHGRARVLGRRRHLALEQFAAQIIEAGKTGRGRPDAGEENVEGPLEGSQLMLVNIPSYLRDLARDTGLVGRDTQVWLIAVESLDFYEYRAAGSGRHRARVYAADLEGDSPAIAATFDRRGYLERAEDNGPHGTWQYRMPLARIYPRADTTDATLLAHSKPSL
jgi:hypothetical protein